MEQWVTMTDASRTLGVTERTIRRYVKEGKYQSKLEDGRRYVLIDTAETNPSDDGKLITRMEDEIEYLREELSRTRERSDTIILQLTKQLDKQTLALEDMQNRPLWKRLKMVFVPSAKLYWEVMNHGTINACTYH